MTISAGEKPNILWIQADELRADALSAYEGPTNWPEPHTPAVASLARSGVVFENTFCQSPVCVPSRVSLMLGRYPLETGVCDNHALSASHNELRAMPNLLTVLQHAGYETNSFGKQHLVGVAGWDRVSEVDTDPGGGYARFFPLAPHHEGTRDSVRLPGGPRTIIGGTYPAGEVTPTTELTNLALEWLSAHAANHKPWFTHLSYLAPHTPVLPPAEFRERFDERDFVEPPNHFTVGSLSRYEQAVAATQRSDALTERARATARASYWASVTHLDNEIGRVLAAMETHGLTEKTVVILDADHGTMLGEAGMWQKQIFNRASHQVPLIISAPGRLPAGQRRTDLNELIDRIQTVAGLSGINLEQGFRGRDIFDSNPPEYVFGAIGGGGARSTLYPLAGGGIVAPQRLCIRTPAYRLDLTSRFRGANIANDGEEADIFVADIRADPLEQTNIARQLSRETRAELLGALADWRRVCTQKTEQVEPARPITT